MRSPGKSRGAGGWSHGPKCITSSTLLMMAAILCLAWVNLLHSSGIHAGLPLYASHNLTVSVAPHKPVQRPNNKYWVYQGVFSSPDDSQRCQHAHICDGPYVSTNCSEGGLGCMRSASQRQAAIKTAMQESWTTYRKHAWGHDELCVLLNKSLSYRDWQRQGLTIIDSMSTLLLMNLNDEYQAARNWAIQPEQLLQTQAPISVFENNIRVLGGLLSAYALTGSTDGALLAKAQQVADSLLQAFNTSTGVPDARYVPAQLVRDGYDSRHNSLAAAGTFSLELTTLSHFTGNQTYANVSSKLWTSLFKLPSCDGMYCTWFNSDYLSCSENGWGWELSMSANADSFYEYMLKQWIMSRKTDKDMLDHYRAAMAGVRKHLIVSITPCRSHSLDSSPSSNTYVNASGKVNMAEAADVITSAGWGDDEGVRGKTFDSWGSSGTGSPGAPYNNAASSTSSSKDDKADTADSARAASTRLAYTAAAGNAAQAASVNQAGLGNSIPNDARAEMQAVKPSQGLPGVLLQLALKDLRRSSWDEPFWVVGVGSHFQGMNAQCSASYSSNQVSTETILTPPVPEAGAGAALGDKVQQPALDAATAAVPLSRLATLPTAGSILRGGLSATSTDHALLSTARVATDPVKDRHARALMAADPAAGLHTQASTATGPAASQHVHARRALKQLQQAAKSLVAASASPASTTDGNFGAQATVGSSGAQATGNAGATVREMTQPIRNGTTFLVARSTARKYLPDAAIVQALHRRQVEQPGEEKPATSSIKSAGSVGEVQLGRETGSVSKLPQKETATVADDGVRHEVVVQPDHAHDVRFDAPSDNADGATPAPVHTTTSGPTKPLTTTPINVTTTTSTAAITSTMNTVPTITAPTTTGPTVTTTTTTVANTTTSIPTITIPVTPTTTNAPSPLHTNTNTTQTVDPDTQAADAGNINIDAQTDDGIMVYTVDGQVVNATSDVQDADANNSFLAARKSEAVTTERKLHHLACFLPGLLTLGHMHGVDTRVRESATPWAPSTATQGARPVEAQTDDDLLLAAKLMRGCYELYRNSNTGVAGDELFWTEVQSAENGTCHKAMYGNSDNFLRPEVVESLFYLWRATRDPVYREWGWQIFRAYHEHSRMPFGGYVGLQAATTSTPWYGQQQESFWLAETLKYLYLLFSDDPTLLPLDKWVLNTEAHPMPVWS